MFWERSQTPLCYRALEGLSAGLSFLMICIYQSHDRWLLFTYFVHWCCAFYFHLTYSMIGYKADREMIRMMICERLQRADPFMSRILRVWYVLQSTTMDLRIMAVIATVFTMLRISSSWYYMGFHIAALFFNLMADVLVSGGGSTLCTMIFHAFLAMTTTCETTIVSPKTGAIEWVLRYACWLMVVFQIVEKVTSWPNDKMFRICTLTTSLLLSPVGLYELAMMMMYRQDASCSEMYVEEFDYRVHSICLYLAYVLVDAYLGLIRFPGHFRWLEGVIHHTLTGLIAIGGLLTGDTFPICVAFIAEVSTVVMTLRHLVPMPRQLFPTFFVSFRILLLGCMVVFAFVRGQISIFWVMLYILFTCINVHWFIRMIES
jgi:hypothetical protein